MSIPNVETLQTASSSKSHSMYIIEINATGYGMIQCIQQFF